MFKTEITQIIQIVKIFSHFFIKKLFNLILSKIFIFFLSITSLSCATYTANSDELTLNLIKCEVSRSVSKKMDYEFIKSSSNKFTKKLDLLGQNKNNYNLFISMLYFGYLCYTMDLDCITCISIEYPWYSMDIHGYP